MNTFRHQDSRQNQRWSPTVAIKRKHICNNEYLNLSIHDSNKIPTVTSTFSGTSNTPGPMWIISDVGVTGKSKIAAINRKPKVLKL